MRFHATFLIAALAISEGWAQCVDCDGDGFIPPIDCDDGSPGVHPGVPELCDGLDNDCDGHVDGLPGCDGTCGLADKLGADRRLSDPLVPAADSPAIVWTGSEYGVAWEQDFAAQREIFFRRLDSGGVPLGPAVRVTFTPTFSFVPHLAWNGSGYGLTWLDETGLFFVRLDAMGQRIGADVAISPGTAMRHGHAIVWTGSEYGIAWDLLLEGSNSEIFFTRLDRQGTALGPPIRVTNAPTTSLMPDLAWTGSGFGLDWYDLRDGNTEIYFARLAADGTKIGADVRVTNTPTDTFGPQIEWSGSEFGVVWQDQPDLEIFFARLDVSGNLIGLPLRVTNNPALSNHPALVRTGNGYGIVWYDLRDGNAEIYFQHVSAGGLLVGGPVRLTADPKFADHPAIAWSGTSFAVAWYDERLSVSGVYSTRVGCGCMDSDGDGFSGCRDCDETRLDVHPGAPDGCDGLDQNCDGVDGIDLDLDGFSSCTGDCNDQVPQWNPGAEEVCDGRDNDCSGAVDDVDHDGDGFAVCQDCDDADPAQNPAMPEVCDGVDNNCNGVVDEGLPGPDADGDRMPDTCDNCPAIANFDQTDLDQDGTGDACDLDDGLIWVNLPDNTRVAWQPELGFDSFNEYRGDLAVLRGQHLYTQDPATVPLAARNCGLGATSVFDGPNPPVGRGVFFLVTGIRSGVEGSLGTDSTGQERPNDHPCP
jgi:hypothetical protein